MMKKILCLAFLLYAGGVFAQDETIKKLQKDAIRDIKKNINDTTEWTWKKGGTYNLSLSQGSLSNWAAGGDEFSLSVNTILSLFAFHQKDKHSWDNTLDLNFGYIRTTSLGSRKNDDRIDLLSKYGYAVSSDWNVATLVNFRTQALRGYDYNDSARTLTSTFLSPAYVLTSVGMDYKPNDEFSLFLSPITSRWVIVKNDSLSAKGLYGVEPGRHTRNEIGAFVTATYIKDINPNVSYKGRLDLFSNYRHNPQNVDVFMSNILSVKLWKVISASWNVDLIYDDDARLFGKNGTSPRIQLKSLVGIGLGLQF
ncbi:MAG TPA: DUF3078 domain-containing protein [Flavisolibacter sp.]|nr:DUF3078 domain-containing protein [Flavisolibacter sp.]